MKNENISIELILQASLIIGILIYQFLVIVFAFEGVTSDTPISSGISYQGELSRSKLKNSIKEISIEENSKIQIASNFK